MLLCGLLRRVPLRDPIPPAAWEAGSRRAIPHPSVVLLHSLPEFPTMPTAYNCFLLRLTNLELALSVAARSH
jgi:hypothetical protein